MQADLMLQTVELKPFIPARDFELSNRFYRELGFIEGWRQDGLAELRLGECAFLLQDFYRKDWAQNCVLFLQVNDINSWWRRIQSIDLAGQYPGSKAIAPEDKPWGMRQLSLIDPSGVLWQIGELMN